MKKPSVLFGWLSHQTAFQHQTTLRRQTGPRKHQRSAFIDDMSEALGHILHRQIATTSKERPPWRKEVLLTSRTSTTFVRRSLRKMNLGC